MTISVLSDFTETQNTYVKTVGGKVLYSQEFDLTGEVTFTLNLNDYVGRPLLIENIDSGDILFRVEGDGDIDDLYTGQCSAGQGMAGRAGGGTTCTVSSTLPAGVTGKIRVTVL